MSLASLGAIPGDTRGFPLNLVGPLVCLHGFQCPASIPKQHTGPTPASNLQQEAYKFICRNIKAIFSMSNMACIACLKHNALSIKTTDCTRKLISLGEVDVCTPSLAPYEISVPGSGSSARTDAQKLKCDEVFIMPQSTERSPFSGLLFIPTGNSCLSASWKLFSPFVSDSNILFS